MELFDLVAKLTLDTNEYDSAVHQAESDAESIDDIEADLTLNDQDFTENLDAAKEAPEPDKNADLTLTDQDFGTNLESAEQEPDPDKDADLTLEDVDYSDNLETADGLPTPDKDADLTIETQPYTDGLAEAEAQTGSFEGSVESVFDGISEYIEAAGIVGAIAAIVSSLGEAVDLARSMGDNIDKSSRAMSISTDAYQEWSHVLDINGASITDLNRGLMNMRKVMQGGKVTDEVTEGFTKLGLSFKIASGEIGTTEELLEATLKALADYDGADRDVIATALFGRGGTKLNALFDGTSDDIEFLKKQAHELGMVMSEDAVAAAATYNDAVTNMNASIEAFKRSIGEDLLPELTNVVNTITQIVTWLNPKTRNQQTLSGQLEDINDEASRSAYEAEEAAEEAKSLIDRMVELGDRAGLNAKEQDEWNRCAERAIELFPQLQGVIDKESGSIKGNTDEIKKNIDQWKASLQEKAIALALEKKQQAILDQEAKAWDKEWEAKEKLREADRRRADVIAELNKYSFTGFEKLGEDATFEQIREAVDIIKSAGGIGDYEWEDTVDKMVEELENPLQEAEKLQAEADKMTAEVNKAKDELAQETEYLNSVMTETQTKVEGVGQAVDDLPDEKDITINILPNWGDFDGGIGSLINKYFRPKAKGDWLVPYDNMPALLHRGERVLTATEARQMDSSTGGSDFSGMYDIVKNAIRAGMSDVSVNSYLSGKDVTDDVNRTTGRQLKARRFRG